MQAKVGLKACGQSGTVQECNSAVRVAAMLRLSTLSKGCATQA